MPVKRAVFPMPSTVRILAVGKVKEPYLAAGLAEYQKRLRPFCKLDVIELKDEGVEREAAAFERHLEKARAENPNALFILDAGGEHLDSLAFAKLVKTHQTSTLTFLIGSAEGIAPSLKSKAKLLSLSKMTFTHEMARLFLVEQIYRAHQINSGRPYHK